MTDTSACLTRRQGFDLGVAVLPIELFVGGHEFLGDDEGAEEAVARALELDEPIKSSAPSVSSYLSAIEEAPTEEVVILTPAREFTRMYDNAWLASSLTDRAVTVIDTRTAAGAQGLVVLRAARSAAGGAPGAEVAGAAADAVRRAELVASLPGLDTLRASGRVQAGALTLARHLGIRPVFRLHDGRVERLGIPRDEDAAIRRIVREASRRGFTPHTEAVLMHVGSERVAHKLGEALGCRSPIARFSPAMAAHTGPGLVGVAWLREVDPSAEATP